MSAAKVGECDTVPAAEHMTIQSAVKSLLNACDFGVVYDFSVMEDDGNVFRRFSRSLPLEAWLVATPTTTSGQRVVCPIAFDPRRLASEDAKESLAGELRSAMAVLNEKPRP